jgi:hypothetical protein
MMHEHESVNMANNPLMDKLLTVYSDPYEAVKDSHAITAITEWDEFKTHDYAKIYAGMANGGGYPETTKAQQIEKILGGGVSVLVEYLCMSHTPMRELVLTVGKDGVQIRHLMADYGFKHVVTDLHEHFSAMYPDVKVAEPVLHNGRFDAHPFAAVFVLIDPIYWGRELQIVMDVLCSPDGLLGQRTMEGDGMPASASTSRSTRRAPTSSTWASSTYTNRV